jgi:hypothetical protein
VTTTSFDFLRVPVRGSGLIFLAGFATLFIACTTEPTEEAIMQANGTFDVKITPQQSDNPDATAANVSRLSLNKQYRGALAAASHGEMLALGDGTKSGAYVALEKVSGSLDGREGSFALVHRSALRDGEAEGWSVTVVPDSGTAELSGLEGTMTIIIREAEHYYEFSYSLP